MKRLIYTAAALRQLRTAARWYNDQAPHLGARFVEALETREQVLSAFPESCKRVDERFRCAQVPRFPYSMYYHVLEEAIVVVAVIHTSQHPESWKTPQPPSGQG